MDGLITTSKNKKKPFVDYSNKLTVELIVSQFTFFQIRLEIFKNYYYLKLN